MNKEQAFKNIFPNGDINLFLNFFNWWHDVDSALWSYGEIRKDEYLKEKAALKQAMEVSDGKLQ